MREIKFRVWDKNAQTMIKGGAFMDVSQTPGVDRWIFGLDVFNHPDDVELMQYTGLKDRNGVEIYEGDVIRAKHDDGRYDIGNIVYGSKGAFCLHLPNVGTGIKTPLLNYIHGIMFAEFDFEVIGNIYEHPDLLPDTNTLKESE